LKREDNLSLPVRRQVEGEKKRGDLLTYLK
jgi:hypothetical protein